MGGEGVERLMMEFWNSLPELAQSAVLTAFILILAYIISTVGIHILRTAMKKVLPLELFYPTIKGIWKTIVYITAFSAFLNYVVGMSTGAFLASIGVSAVLIGVAAQAFVRDLIMGFVILGTQKFVIGDTITVRRDYTGVVDKITIQNTRLLCDDGSLHVIANSCMDIITIIKRADEDTRPQGSLAVAGLQTLQNSAPVKKLRKRIGKKKALRSAKKNSDVESE
jgi:small conductance mechanosensitive channel